MMPRRAGTSKTQKKQKLKELFFFIIEIGSTKLNIETNMYFINPALLFPPMISIIIIIIIIVIVAVVAVVNIIIAIVVAIAISNTPTFSRRTKASIHLPLREYQIPIAVRCGRRRRRLCMILAIDAHHFHRLNRLMEIIRRTLVRFALMVRVVLRLLLM